MPWTSTAKNTMMKVALAGDGMPDLWLALFSDSANPATSPTELTLAGYARQHITFVDDGINAVVSAVDLAFGPLAAGSYLGVGVLDDATAGSLWFWADESSPVTIPGSSTVDFAAGTIPVSQTG